MLEFVKFVIQCYEENKMKMFGFYRARPSHVFKAVIIFPYFKNNIAFSYFHKNCSTQISASLLLYIRVK